MPDKRPEDPESGEALKASTVPKFNGIAQRNRVEQSFPPACESIRRNKARKLCNEPKGDPIYYSS
jgi:hypothetical protein